MLVMQDTACTLDYIGIAGSGGACQDTNTLPYVTNRLCGPFFNVQANGMNDLPVCYCSAPFSIGVFTDALDDTGVGGATGANTAQSRGTCLTWNQIPC